MKVLIAGAGAMARKHILAYRKLKDVEVVGIVNRNSARAESLQQEFQVPKLYSDLEEAIKTEKPEILSVCLPTSFHAPVSIKAMSLGVHVLCEKPIALQLEEGLAMIRESEKSKKKLSVVFNRRFNDTWHELVKRLPTIGSPIVYNVQEIRSIRPKLAMHSKSLNGGPVVDCTVHDFDMLLKLFGKANSVYASGAIFGANKPSLASIKDFAIDTAHLDVEFEGGNRAYLLYAWGFPEKCSYWQWREFFGPDGIIRLMGEFGEEIVHYRSNGTKETVQGLQENGHEVLIKLFVEAVQKDRDVPVRAEEALEASRIALTSLRSIESGNKEIIG